MSELLYMLPQSFEQGVIYSLAVLGFALALRMLAYADLTLEGSFVLGGVVSAVWLRGGHGAIWTIPLALLAGAIAGLFTATQHCYLRISKLLSGIITLSILYTVNLRIQQRPNESFYDTETVFSYLPEGTSSLWLVLPIALGAFLFCYRLLRTEFGLYLRACGENDSVVRRAGMDRRWFILLGLAISNGMIALSGGICSQYMGFSDVNISGGLIVVALTSLILGEVIFRPATIRAFMLSVLVGSVLCQFINTACLYLNLHPSDHKGVVGLLLIGLIAFRNMTAETRTRRNIGADIL